MAYPTRGIIVIGGGGVGGAFSCGALTGLRHPFRHLYAGTSIGALLAAAIATGREPSALIHMIQVYAPRAFEKSAWLRDFLPEWLEKDMPPIASALYDATALSEMIKETVPGHDASMKGRDNLCITAFDMDSGKTVRITDGSVHDAIIASSAAPSWFDAAGEGRFMDGGLGQNVPVFAAREAWPAIAAASDVLIMPNGGKYDYHSLAEGWDIRRVGAVIEAMMSAQVNLALDMAHYLFRKHTTVKTQLSFALDDVQAIPLLASEGRAASPVVSDWETRL